MWVIEVYFHDGSEMLIMRDTREQIRARKRELLARFESIISFISAPYFER